MATTFDVIYLGVLADMDTVEGDSFAEGAGGLVGLTLGSSGDPLHDHVQSFSPGTTGYAGGDPTFYDHSQQTDTFSIDGGADQIYDMGMVFDVTITYIDGTTATATVGIVQDTAGNAYLVPQTSLDANQLALEAAPIESITLDTAVYGPGGEGYGLLAERYDGTFSQPVDGTSGDDIMGLGYTDSDGDQITIGDDYILAGDGNDVINAGHGDDVVYAGAGDDVIEDWDGNDTIYAEAGNDTAHVGIGNDTFYMGTGDDTVVVWDNAGVNTIFGGDDFDTLDFDNWQSSDAATVTFTGDGSGTFSHYSGATTGTFSEFEAISGTAYADTIDASADTTGMTLSGEGGDDSITGGSGDDTIAGGTGADIMDGGGGDDTFVIEDGFGNDTITGGETGEINGDTIDARLVTVPLTVVYTSDEAGTITDGTYTITFSEIENLVLGSGNDTADASVTTSAVNIDGGAGDDTITGGAGDDTLTGGAGNDTLVAGFGSDTLFGGDGDDLLIRDGTDVNDIRNELYGGAGNDTIRVEGGVNAHDVIDGGDGIDTFELLPGDNRDFTIDMVLGQAADGTVGTQEFINIENITAGGGNDTIIGDSGNNVLDGGAGNDSISAGAGDDTLIGGTGDDTLTGGDGNDTFIYNAGDGADTITDFNTGNTGTLSDGDNTNNDFIDLSAFYDYIWELHADQADDGILNQSNDGVGWVDYSNNTQFQPGDSLTFTGATADGSFFTVENTGIVCYVAGSRILTAKGEVVIESLKPGDEVMTRDHGAQFVRWIGMTTVECTEDLAPIRIRVGALGDGSPKRDLFVSPQHRMLVRSKIVERMTGNPEALVAATKLQSLAGIRKIARPGSIRYVHLMCDAHEIVYVEGAPSETLLPGPHARTAMGPDAWAELTAIFPEIGESPQNYPPARDIPSNAQQSNLVRRHRRNRTPLLQGA